MEILSIRRKINLSTNDTCIIFVFPETRNPIWRKNEQKERYLKVFYTKCLIGKSRFPRTDPHFTFSVTKANLRQMAGKLLSYSKKRSKNCKSRSVIIAFLFSRSPLNLDIGGMILSRSVPVVFIAPSRKE